MEGIKAMIRRNEFRNGAFAVIGLLSTLIGLFLLAVLLIDLAIDGMPRLSYKFLTSFPSRFPEEAGILSALVGSFLILLVTAASAIPLGIAAGIYLEEYA